MCGCLILTKSINCSVKCFFIIKSITSFDRSVYPNNVSVDFNNLYRYKHTLTYYTVDFGIDSSFVVQVTTLISNRLCSLISYHSCIIEHNCIHV